MKKEKKKKEEKKNGKDQNAEKQVETEIKEKREEKEQKKTSREEKSKVSIRQCCEPRIHSLFQQPSLSSYTPHLCLIKNPNPFHHNTDAYVWNLSLIDVEFMSVGCGVLGTGGGGSPYLGTWKTKKKNNR